jgi:hypothetical protein
MDTNIIVTTGDLKQGYEIIGPVYFQVSNKPEGLSESTLSEYKKEYTKEIEQLKISAEARATRAGIPKYGCAFGKWCLGQSNFEIAFFIAVEELKKRAAMLDADAIIFMRQDIDLNVETYQFFHLQMYGTAVKLT